MCECQFSVGRCAESMSTRCACSGRADNNFTKTVHWRDDSDRRVPLQSILTEEASMTHRTACVLLIIIVLAGGANAQTRASQAGATDVSYVFKPFFIFYCSMCHDLNRNSFGLSLDSFTTGNVVENTA